jgi:hypothetical protein
MVVSCFVIIGNDDACLYEFVAPPPKEGDTAMDMRAFVLHGALDMVTHATLQNNAFLLPKVDTFGEWRISAYAPHGPLRLLLMQDAEPDAAVLRALFAEAAELAVKWLANPFADLAAPIPAGAFTERMKAICLKHLGGGYGAR